MKVFIHDVSICNGCYNCQISCKDEFVGNDWTPYAKPQPDTGQFWMKIEEHIRGTVPKVKMHYIPVFCAHCDDAPCMKVCKVDDAIYKREDGLVIIDPEKCTGCKSCVDSCPYGAIYFNEDLKLAQKCTGCSHLLDKDWKEPRCVDACPTGALKFMEESEAQELIDKAETLIRGQEIKARAYYLNVPKKFIAGTIYDPVKKEIIEGAKCTLISISDGQTYVVKTDGFGDFWFEGLTVSCFSLRIEAGGFKSKILEGITTEKDVNLGDIPVTA